MKAIDITSLITGKRENYELFVKVDVLGQVITKRIVSVTTDELQSKIIFILEKVELR